MLQHLYPWKKFKIEKSAPVKRRIEKIHGHNLLHYNV